jgi:nucleotide-binding universal stress UspA family protein
LEDTGEAEMKNGYRLQFETIVVATDLTQGGSAAFRYAQAIAAQHKSVLVIVHVIDPVGYAFPEGAPELATADQNARDELRQIEEEIRHSGIPVHSIVETGVVYERILQTILDHQGDLLVLGTRAKTTIGRAALGTVARQLLAKAHCPVLTVPPDADANLQWAGRWHHVLIATDFSPASIYALNHAQRIADRRLIVLHAPKDPSEHEPCLERLRFLAPFNESHTVPVEHIVTSGEPGKVIAEHAQQFHADLIILGSPVNELAEEDIHTSTVLQVISSVNCPVLCVPFAKDSSLKDVLEEVTVS